MTFDEWLKQRYPSDTGPYLDFSKDFTIEDVRGAWNAALDAAAKACEDEPMFNEDDPGETFAAVVRKLTALK